MLFFLFLDEFRESPYHMKRLVFCQNAFLFIKIMLKLNNCEKREMKRFSH